MNRIEYLGSSTSTDLAACYRVVFDDGHSYEYHTPACRKLGLHKEEPT